MILKTTMMLVISATLVASIFVLGNNAYAVEPGDIRETMADGNVILRSTEGETIAQGTFEYRFQLLVQDIDEVENVSGVANGQMSITLDGIGQNSFVNQGPLTFEYDTMNRILSMQGIMTDQNGNLHSFIVIEDLDDEMFIQPLTSTETAFTIEFSIGTVSGDGDGIMGIPWQDIVIKSKGDATCQTPSGSSCGEGDMKTKLTLGFDTSNGSTLVGPAKASIDLEIESSKTKLKTTSLAYQYDELGNVVAITGTLVGPNGNIWQIDMVIEEVDLISEVGNCNTELTAPDESIIISDTMCGVILAPIST